MWKKFSFDKKRKNIINEWTFSFNYKSIQSQEISTDEIKFDIYTIDLLVEYLIYHWRKHNKTHTSVQNKTSSLSSKIKINKLNTDETSWLTWRDEISFVCLYILVVRFFFPVKTKKKTIGEKNKKVYII